MPDVKKQIAKKRHAPTNFRRDQKKLTASITLPKATPAPLTGTVGAPTLYKPELCQALIEAGENGLTKIQFIAKIGISKETFYRWKEENPEFRKAIEVYEAKLESWYTSLVKNKMLGIAQNITGKDGTTQRLNLDLGGLIWFGKNVCGWKDRQEQVISVGTNIVEVSKEENEMIT